jgi:hypothetical protein
LREKQEKQKDFFFGKKVPDEGKGSSGASPRPTAAVFLLSSYPEHAPQHMAARVGVPPLEQIQVGREGTEKAKR